MEKLVFLGLVTSEVLACILIVNILNTVSNSVPISSTTGHLGLASIQFLLSLACTLLDPGDLHGLV